MTKRAFSLVELIIVIAIMGIMGSIAAYSWQRYVHNANLKTAARDITADIANTRTKAVSERLTYRIKFSVENNYYTVEKANQDGSYTNIVTKTLSIHGRGSGITLQRVNFPENTLYFYTRGTCNPGSLKIVNNRGSEATITINITGRTYVTFSMQ
ncbi:MAG: GspH/FimT family pseudopilin [Syntrophales bacterium]|nr:GspH/FimT family pseudopilin [Syntrophales bacterium]